MCKRGTTRERLEDGVRTYVIEIEKVEPPASRRSMGVLQHLLVDSGFKSGNPQLEICWEMDMGSR